MKSYPSIPNSGGQSFEGLGLVHVFDKLDGSNLRAEWTKKRGWFKFGSRTQLIDETSEQFPGAIEKLVAAGEQVRSLLRQKRAPQKIVIFGEWHGLHSFAGVHDPDDVMRFSVFDVCVDNRGWMDPKEFVRRFVGEMDTPEYLGTHNWTRGLVQGVRNGHWDDDVTFEGIVGKTLVGPRLHMGKAKTEQWIEKVQALYTPEEAEKIINS